MWKLPLCLLVLLTFGSGFQTHFIRMIKTLTKSFRNLVLVFSHLPMDSDDPFKRLNLNSLEPVTLKYHLHVCFWDDFLSSHMGKPYDISWEDLLANRTSLVHVYLMFVVYRTKGLKYNSFYLCVCVCVCVCSSCCIAMHIYMYFILYL